MCQEYSFDKTVYTRNWWLETKDSYDKSEKHFCYNIKPQEGTDFEFDKEM